MVVCGGRSYPLRKAKNLSSFMGPPHIANLYPEPGQLQGVFLVEEEEARLMFTALQRDRGFSEKSSTEQQQIVRTSWMFGQWLKAEADIHSVPVVNPLPYETLLERVLQAVQVNE